MTKQQREARDWALAFIARHKNRRESPDAFERVGHQLADDLELLDAALTTCERERDALREDRAKSIKLTREVFERQHEQEAAEAEVDRLRGEWDEAKETAIRDSFITNLQHANKLDREDNEAEVARLRAALKTTLRELQAVQEAAAFSGLPAIAWAGFGGAAKKALAPATAATEAIKVGDWVMDTAGNWAAPEEVKSIGAAIWESANAEELYACFSDGGFWVLSRLRKVEKP